MTVFAFILLIGLAVGRIAALVTMDGITEPIRHRVFLLSPPVDDPDSELYWYVCVDRHGNPLSERWPRDPGWFGKLVSCYHCVGVWVAVGAVAGIHLIPAVTIPVLLVAAIAQVSDLSIKAAR